MLLMLDRGIRGEMYHAIYRYATVNNKYMRNHKKDKDSSYLIYWDAKNLCKRTKS